MKKILIIVILFCFNLSTQAHVGEHSINQVHSKIWHFQDKSMAVEGYFLFTKNNEVFIQNQRGKVQSFEINKLSWMDKNYVNRRIIEIGVLNKEVIPLPQKSSSNYALIYILSLGLILFFLKKSNLVPYFSYSLILVVCACLK